MRPRSPSPAAARHPRPSWGPRSTAAQDDYSPAGSTSSSSQTTRTLPLPSAPAPPPPLPRWDRAGPASSSANATVSTAPNRWTAAAKAGAAAAAAASTTAEGSRASSTAVEDGPAASFSTARPTDRSGSEPQYGAPSYGNSHPDGPPPARGGPMMPPSSSSAYGRRRSPSPQRPFRSPSPPGRPAYGASGSYGSASGSFRPPPPSANGSSGPPYPPPSRIPSASSSSSAPAASAGGSLPPFLPQRPNFSPPRKRPFGPGGGYEDERDDYGPRGGPPSPSASNDYHPYRDDSGGRASWERDWTSAPSSSSSTLPPLLGVGGGGLRRQHPADDWDRRRESDAREKDRLERTHRERDSSFGPPSSSSTLSGEPTSAYGRRNGGLPPPPAPLPNGQGGMHLNSHSLSPPLLPRRSMWPERHVNGSGPPDRPLPPHLASAGLPPRRRTSASPPPLPSYRRDQYDRPLASSTGTLAGAPPQPLGAPRSNTRFSSPYPTATAAGGLSSPAAGPNGRGPYPPPPHLLPRFGPSAAGGVNGGRSSYPIPPPSAFGPYGQHASNGAGGGPDHNAGRGESISLDYRESRSPERTPAAGRRRPSNASSSTTTTTGGGGGGPSKRTASPPPTTVKRQPGANQWDRSGGQAQQHRRSSSVASVNGGGESSSLPVKQEALDRDGLPPLPSPAVGGWADVLTGPDGKRRPLPPPVVAPSSSSFASSGRSGNHSARQDADRFAPMGPPPTAARPSEESQDASAGVIVGNGIAVDDEKEEGEEDESPPPPAQQPQTKSLLQRLSSPPPLLAAAARSDGSADLARPAMLSPPRPASPHTPAISAPSTTLQARQSASPPPPASAVPSTAANPPAATAAAVEPPQSPDHHSPRTPPETVGEETARVVGPISPESAPPTAGGEQHAEEKVQVVLGSPDALVVLRTEVLTPATTSPTAAIAAVPSSPAKAESALAIGASPSEQLPAILPIPGLPTGGKDLLRSTSRSPSRALETLLNPNPVPAVCPSAPQGVEVVTSAVVVEEVEPMDVDASTVEVKAEEAAVPLTESSEAMEVDEQLAEAETTPPPAATGDDADDDADMSSVSRSSLTQDEMLDLVKAHVVSHARAAAGALLSDGEIGQIIGFNACLADPVSSRLPRQAKVKETVAVAGPSYNPSTKPLKVIEGLSAERQASLRAAVAQRVELALATEAARLTALRSEYRTLNAEWTASCARLDRVTEKRKAAKRPAVNQHARTPSVYTPGGASSTPSQGTGLGGFDDFRPGRTSRSTRGNYPEQGYFQDVVRSEAEFQSILASLGDADYLDPNLRAARTAAVVPDMVRDPMARERDAYDDANGLVLDPDAFYEITTSTDVWTDEEREIFAKKFASHPKQFGKIADALPHKTADQCVLYYYRHKKTINFRAIALPARRRKGRRAGKASRLMANLEGKQKKASGGADQPLSARGDGDETAPPSPLAPTMVAAIPTPSSAAPSSTSRKRKQPTADKSSLGPPSSSAKPGSTSPADMTVGTPTAPPRVRNGKSLLGSLMNPSPAVGLAITATASLPPPPPVSSKDAPAAATAAPNPLTS